MSICHLNQSNQIETSDGVCLNHPAVQIIAEDDVFVRFGEYETLNDRVNRECNEAFSQRDAILEMGIPFIMPVQTVISLENFESATACYVIRRMVEYSASGFVSKFFQKIQEPDVDAWLNAEMTRVPIDVTK